MKTTLKKKVGSTVFEFEFEEGKVKDALFTAASFSTIPEQCGLCKSDNVQLLNNKAEKDGKTFKYVKVRCLVCNATATMGEYADGQGVFWKRFEKYQPQGEQPVKRSSQSENHSEEVDVDDIPF